MTSDVLFQSYVVWGILSTSYEKAWRRNTCSHEMTLLLFLSGKDFTFAVKRGKRAPNYGTAGDCYSKSQCPQVRVFFVWFAALQVGFIFKWIIAHFISMFIDLLMPRSAFLRKNSCANFVFETVESANIILHKLNFVIFEIYFRLWQVVFEDSFVIQNSCMISSVSDKRFLTPPIILFHNNLVLEKFSKHDVSPWK